MQRKWNPENAGALSVVPKLPPSVHASSCPALPFSPRTRALEAAGGGIHLDGAVEMKPKFVATVFDAPEGFEYRVVGSDPGGSTSGSSSRIVQEGPRGSLPDASGSDNSGRPHHHTCRQEQRVVVSSPSGTSPATILDRSFPQVERNGEPQ